ncbi:glutamate receptor ionotropic, NMDA 2B-like [Mercenaria mercenaria]|uniref:glutamate receptor ionotropic, NMDA 2B-like n=1 Tax=Mercenaria mercenaria TaxID=6596 RepID=UPI00234FAF32|nr:glutamate receptor ionotropic, NMDA 2B-like [Mercenaria mercenaria]XP_045171590.2 glutamate receptor ionotropic, NMDA 2B-like [Mercenaria mercenaria]XP_045171591.2 glutamate receptor ionotropic, NMDA 2B-like [Mercenaria mercenaria]XP_045171592.2 glutamate receptor ionotropic, NMDA 2B-like [Mercenaria mercenaria]XP_053375502.1 glutamate receptor ionotropic, NMDA 2B-like [Mercenaria mercenaria]XP_053375503.1 glutamate receptor ionotropic, NMDA 2B-like [Mercenaria mercenaria]XP_053375504.1 gl
MASSFKILLLFFCDMCLALDLSVQIVAPERATENNLRSAISRGSSAVNGGRYNPLRSEGLFVEADIFFIHNEFPTPQEITEFYCSEVFQKNASAVMSINYNQLTSRATDYIEKTALSLGMPVISWDPVSSGALQSDQERLVLQLAPTIYHECEAMILLMERYNWTEFSIVTMRDMGEDFIQCMELMVNLTSIQQGYTTKPRFTNIATIVLEELETEYGFLTDSQTEYVKTELQKLVKARSRIILFHAKHFDTRNIIEVAIDLNLIGPKFAWILTSSSIGEVDLSRSGTSLPQGLLAVSQNRSVEKVEEAIETAVKIYGESLKTLLRSGMNSSEFYPDFSCNGDGDFLKWIDGKTLYSAMKNIELKSSSSPRSRGSSSSRTRFSSSSRGRVSTPDTSVPIKFTENGVIQHVELNLLNVRPSPESRIRGAKQWDKVGRLYPKVEGTQVSLTLDIDEIIWPGKLPTPPRGKPEKRAFKIATKEEEPFMIFIPPALDGKCGHHQVPCLVNAGTAKSNTSYPNGTVSYCCTGMCVEILETLAEQLNFEYTLYEVPDGEWGIKDPVTKEWNGLIKELLDEKADMVVTNFIIDEMRLGIIDFSTPYLESGVTIMVSIRKGAISPYAFLEPYDFYSWILILIFSVHATGASIFIFEWLSPSGLDQGKTSTVEHKFSLFRSFWLIWAMLFGAAVSIDVPRGVSSRFLANVWALFALVFLASYTANLAAFMITIDEYYDLSGIEDWRLLKPTTLTPHFKFATINSTSTDSNLKTTYPKMHKYMSKYSQVDVKTAKQNLKNNSIHAFIYDANVLEYTAGRDEECSLLTVGRWYAMSGYGVGFRRGSILKDEVDAAILNMQFTGDIERLEKFWLSGACHAKKEKKDKRSNKIGILNFISAFILLATGVLLSVILIVLEHLYFKSGRKCLKKYDKCGCCALVSLSMGKSLTFEQSVFEAIDIQRKHKCKDPICEMNIWKARHQLDIALLKIKNMQKEIDDAETSKPSGSNIETNVDVSKL